MQRQNNSLIVTLAAIVVVLAGIQAAQSVLVPFLLSCFIAIVSAPVLFALKKRGVPTSIALLLVILAIAMLGTLLGVLIGSSIDDFSVQLPFYQERLNGLLSAALAWLGGNGIFVPRSTLVNVLDPAQAMQMAAAGLSSLGGLFTNTLLILLTVIFILLEASGFSEKLQRIMPNSSERMERLRQFSDNIKHYMVIKSATSLLTGVAIALLLWWIGVDYPLLWGTLAFLLNFVPNIGSVIAAIPPLLLSLVQLGVTGTLAALLGVVVINGVVGNIIEPRYLGRGLGLSTLVVFLSLVFWGWLLGPVGMFLSVPLTMMTKIALDSQQETKWIAELLGHELETTPACPDTGQKT